MYKQKPASADHKEQHNKIEMWQVKPESINITTLLKENLGKSLKGHIQPGSNIYLPHINTAIFIYHT